MEVKIDDSWYQVPDPVVIRMQENYTALTVANKKYDQLRAAIEKVREKQKLYFKSQKAFNLLEDAKAAERELDDILTPINSQIALF